MIIEKIHNAQTGQIEIIEREETSEEKLERENAQKAKTEALKRQEEKIAARALILERLGITEEEAQILLG